MPDKESESVTLDTLFQEIREELGCSYISGGEFADDTAVTSPRIQKLGLALSGYPQYIHEGRVQVYGQSEHSFISELDETSRHNVIEAFSCSARAFSVACLVFSFARFKAAVSFRSLSR